MNAGKRRGRGEGGLSWDDSRKRWIATVTVGYTPAGKRIVRKGSGRTRTAALDKLRGILRDHEDGLVAPAGDYTVSDAVENWLAYGLTGRDPATVTKYATLARTHIIPELGARKLRQLSADDVDKWLAAKAASLSTATLQILHSALKRSVTRAQARDKVKRNVVLLCQVPKGQAGRPSKALTLAQAVAVLTAAGEDTPLIDAYINVSLLTGARTEELRPLRWPEVDLNGRPATPDLPEVPPHLMVWRSVRAGGDTKTVRSRRTLALPWRAVSALADLQVHQHAQRATAKTWHDPDLVFASRVGTQLGAGNVRRAFRRVIARAGLNPADWTPQELRHSFVSLLSDEGLPLEQISLLVGHKGGSNVTETVYRQQIRPVIQHGALLMDRIFGATTGEPQLPR